MMRKLVVVAGCVWCLSIGHARAADEAPAGTLGTSMSLTGLSGLLVTESTHTLAPWSLAVSGAALFAHTTSPTSSLYEVAGLVALGLPGRIELAAVLPGVRTDPAVGSSETGLGDLQLSAKWRAIAQHEDQWPSLGVVTTVTLPTGQYSKGLGTPLGPVPSALQHYGVAIKALVSADIDLSPDLYAVGLYADAGYYFQDLNDPTQDKMGLYAAGAALPLIVRSDNVLASPLQLLLEVNGTYKRGSDQDYATFSPSLRYVGPVTVTAGLQYSLIHNSPDALGGVVQLELKFR